MTVRGRLQAALAAAGIVAAFGLSGCDTALREKIELYVDGSRQIRAEGIVYVDGTAGDDANPGTRNLPKKSIQSAIDLAAALMDEGEVHVAEGNYNVYETLEVKKGISLCGGYQGSDWTRDIDAYTTVIEAVSVDTVIKSGHGVTPETVIEGFTIKAALVTQATCIWCERSSPTIQRNMLDAGQGGTDTIGIINSSGSPVIIANTINAGDGTESAWGIANDGSAAKIWSNVIYGTGSNGKYVGILSSNSDAVIQNNTIRCGLHADDVGIYNTGSHCIIENNILFSSADSCGIDEAGSAALPVKVDNNDFSGCSPVYHYDSGGLATVSLMEAYLAANSVQAAGNLPDPPLLTGDWHLEITSPCKSAGLDLSSLFQRDCDWTLRANWSIGAYE
jgi:hypothetical protein